MPINKAVLIGILPRPEVREIILVV
jgi:hypothetical protein